MIFGNIDHKIDFALAEVVENVGRCIFQWPVKHCRRNIVAPKEFRRASCSVQIYAQLLQCLRASEKCGFVLDRPRGKQNVANRQTVSDGKQRLKKCLLEIIS